MSMGRNVPICSIACGSGAVLRSSPLNFVTGIKSFDQSVAFAKRGRGGVSGACARSHVGRSRVRCRTGRLAYAFAGGRGGGVGVVFHMDGGSVTFHCRVPGCNSAKDVIVRGRAANFSFPSFAAAFLYPRDSTVVN